MQTPLPAAPQAQASSERHANQLLQAVSSCGACCMTPQLAGHWILEISRADGTILTQLQAQIQAGLILEGEIQARNARVVALVKNVALLPPSASPFTDS